ncbi:hypothetical protein LCGC14_1523770 [marine sediment metagenome]|uniref:Uncharacterized protein n=1 Tax=marine sediment metagenome TaxID=412755 RepID=A0A0F9JIP8_9ZZZZ|nr:hypothetical protein [Pricia sp.]
MASCEKCWADAGSAMTGNMVEQYHKLIDERKETPCTPEEQAGLSAYICGECGRRTVHQYAKVCMNPDCEPIK